MNLDFTSTTTFLSSIYSLISAFGLKFITAIIILFLGKLIAKHLKKTTIKVLEKRETDKAIVTFTSSLLSGSLWVIIIIIALSQVGIHTTSFIAVLGAAGLAIGLSLQGSLSNFASGFLIVIFRPFKVGDFIDTSGNAGTVTSISIFNTVLNTGDNRKIIIPNSQITGSVITNVTAEDKRRVDLVFSVSHNADIKKVTSIITNVLSNHELTLKDPAPFVRMSALTNNSMDFTVRVWSKAGDYWAIYFDVLEQVKNEFSAQNICPPYPNYIVKSE